VANASQQQVAPDLASYDVRVAATPVLQYPAHYADVHIEVGGKLSVIEVEVHGTRLAAFPGGREQPREPGGFVLERVVYEGHDITFLFTQKQLEKMAELA
jgi:hypothetical protein